jgi:hypothetical protein
MQEKGSEVALEILSFHAWLEDHSEIRHAEYQEVPEFFPHLSVMRGGLLLANLTKVGG